MVDGRTHTDNPLFFFFNAFTLTFSMSQQEKACIAERASGKVSDIRLNAFIMGPFGLSLLLLKTEN